MTGGLMDTLNKIGKWYLIKETIRRIFKGTNAEKSSSFGQSTFSSKEPMQNDAYRKDNKNLNI